VNGIAAEVLAQAARTLGKVAFSGRSADEALVRDSSGHAAVRAITLGTLRWYWRLEALASVLLGETRVTAPVRSLLLVSLHQLEYSRNPPEASVSSSVDAVRILGQPRASGLMNALLRRFLRERDACVERALMHPAAAHAHPRWLFDALREHWPAHWQAIIDANNSHPPMTLRVNLSRGSREQYLSRLADQGLGAQALSWSPCALVLEHPVTVTDLPGFAEGCVSVQDAGAQLASALLNAQPGHSVLDACAAPGGKTCAILEATNDLTLTAVDVDQARVGRINDNLQRLKLQARVITADLQQDVRWWDGNGFDRIVLDAPCSATGVIRRHPDIKLLRRQQDIPGFVTTQRRLLGQCLSLLKPGGRLLYSTCSLMPDENERLVEGVLAQHTRARSMPMPAEVALPPQSVPRALGIQLLPGNAALTDGFYYACLTVT
jgi:16S rRNA (cytosine967-C5)-methyltransferase